MKKLLFIFNLLAILGYTGCHSEHEEHEQHEQLEVTSPLIMDTNTTREYVCQIRAINHIELRALEKGYLQDIFVDEGQFVPKGQMMFQIMPMMYQAELKKAEAEANYAEIEYKNAKMLADSNVISPNQLALVQAKYEQAKAELALAQVRLSFTEIKAPFDGIMNRFHVRKGSLLDEGDLLTTLSDISELWVYFNVPEAEYLNYKQSVPADSILEVKLRMANHEMYDQTGYVRTIEADFNNETGNIAFRATFPNPKRLLRHGETGNVVLTVPYKNAIVIPQKATYEVLDQKYVFVVDEHNVLKSRRINVAAEMPDLYIVDKGLNGKEKILLEGLRLVDENDTIQYDYKEPNEVIKHLKLHAE